MTSKTNWSSIILAIAMILGVYFRFSHLSWDQGLSFHPDERNISAAVSKIRFFSRMDPEFFAYGSVPIYLYRLTGDILNRLTNTVSWTYDWGKISLIGRYWSALFSSATILLVFFLGRRLFSPLVGALAGLFVAATPLLIQEAHYGVTESMITFFAVLLTLTANRLILSSFLWAVAGATKISALSFGVIPVATFLSRAIQKKQSVVRIAVSLVFFLITTFIVFFLLSPYTFFRWDKFMESMRYEGGIVSGKLIVVYVYQFLTTQPYLYQLKQLSFTQGVVVGAISIIGFLFLILRPNIAMLWPLLYFVFVSGWYTKFVRYMVPLYPFFSLGAAALLVNFLTNKKTWIRTLGMVLLTLSLSEAVLRSFAIHTVYRMPQTRIAASEWIYQNIPFGQTILTEHWDDGLPVPLPTHTPSSYRIRQLTIYEPDNEQKLQYYARMLSDGDYVILSSRRLYGTLMNIVDMYPITSRYYHMLFSGSLGYEKIAEFSSYPTVSLGRWAITFTDDAAEETVQVYDHPKVMIFKNTKQFDEKTFLSLLGGM